MLKLNKNFQTSFVKSNFAKKNRDVYSQQNYRNSRYF
jgi:hypothetical protein